MSERRLLCARLCTLATLAIACGSDSSPAADSTSTSNASGSGDSSVGESSTTAPPVDTWPYAHGAIKVAFELPEGADPMPLAKTVTVVISMEYGECLQAYYEANPDVQQAGMMGEAIFGGAASGGEGWEELLCSPLFGDHAPCSTVFVTQRFDTIRNLTVTYESLADIGTMPLLFGPIPTAETAGCAAGLEPTMEIIDTTLVRGLDEAEFELWEGQAAVPAAIASRDPDPVVVTVVPYEGD